MYLQEYCSTYIDGVHLVLVLHILGRNSLPSWPGSAHTLPLPIGLILPHLLLDARHLLLVLGGGAAHGEHNLAPEDAGVSEPDDDNIEAVPGVVVEIIDQGYGEEEHDKDEPVVNDDMFYNTSYYFCVGVFSFSIKVRNVFL